MPRNLQVNYPPTQHPPPAQAQLWESDSVATFATTHCTLRTTKPVSGENAQNAKAPFASPLPMPTFPWPSTSPSPHPQHRNPAKRTLPLPQPKHPQPINRWPPNPLLPNLPIQHPPVFLNPPSSQVRNPTNYPLASCPTSTRDGMCDPQVAGNMDLQPLTHSWTGSNNVASPQTH